MTDKPKKDPAVSEKICALTGKVKCLPKAVIAGGAAVVVLLLAVVVFSTSGSSVTCEAPIAFDSKVWADSADIKASNSPRSKMVQNLTEKVVYKGMSKGQSEGIMGKPSSKKFEKAYDAAYFLGGPCGSDSGKSKWLVLDYNGSKLDSWEVISTDD